MACSAQSTHIILSHSHVLWWSCRGNKAERSHKVFLKSLGTADSTRPNQVWPMRFAKHVNTPPAASAWHCHCMLNVLGTHRGARTRMQYIESAPKCPQHLPCQSCAFAVLLCAAPFNKMILLATHLHFNCPDTLALSAPAVMVRGLLVLNAGRSGWR